MAPAATCPSSSAVVTRTFSPSQHSLPRRLTVRERRRGPLCEVGIGQVEAFSRPEVCSRLVAAQCGVLDRALVELRCGCL